MERTSFSRDELLSALRTVAQFLKGFPNIQFTANENDAVEEPHALRDGQAVTDTTRPLDGAPADVGYGKGVPQPPRKRHKSRLKDLSRVDWNGVPRAARRMLEYWLSHGPATSHETMAALQMARPTFNNAMSKLRARKLVESESLRKSSNH